MVVIKDSVVMALFSFVAGRPFKVLVSCGRQAVYIMVSERCISIGTSLMRELMSLLRPLG